MRSGKLVVYRDRTEYVTSSVQKTVFNYAGLVSVKKEWDHIDFITEDGRKESCPADRKCVHEAFLYIEQMVRPYLAQRKESLLARGIYFSFLGLDGGNLDVLADRVEYTAPSGQTEAVSFRDVWEANLYTGMLFDQMENQYGENLLWLNAQQVPKSESGESLSLLVGKKLAEQFQGDSNTSKQTGTLLTGLAGLATGIIVKDISLGKEIAGGVLNKNSANSQESPLALFSKQIEKKDRGKNGKVIFFIDGLDQLDSARAAELLDAMRDYFECKGCVFVVSADYADILRGAQECYGANRAKHFFDEMFKMTFRVPASSFSITSYAKDKLDSRAEISEEECRAFAEVLLISSITSR